VKFKIVIGLAVLALFVVRAHADGTIPYPNIGTVAPTVPLSAATTGEVFGYFVQGGKASGGGAGATDYVRLLDLTTGTVGAWEFQNQTTTAGTVADFGSVNMGDTLAFEIVDLNVIGTNPNFTLLSAPLALGDPTAIILSSEPALSGDGLNHAYITNFSGGTLNGAGIPGGIYVGMEDLPPGVPFSDFNYNDDSFVFTDVAIATPEPNSLFLLGSGLLGLVGFGRRKFVR